MYSILEMSKIDYLVKNRTVDQISLLPLHWCYSILNCKMYLIYSCVCICVKFQGEWLKERRAERVQEWSRFMDQMCDKSSAVDKHYEQEIARVQKYYSDVEEKLRLAQGPSSSPH